MYLLICGSHCSINGKRVRHRYRVDLPAMAVERMVVEGAWSGHLLSRCGVYLHCACEYRPI